MAILRPSGVVSATGWDVVGAANAAAAVNETSPSQAERVVTIAADDNALTYTIGGTIPTGQHELALGSFTVDGYGQVQVALLDASESPTGVSAWVSLTGTASTRTVSVSTSVDSELVRVYVREAPDFMWTADADHGANTMLPYAVGVQSNGTERQLSVGPITGNLRDSSAVRVDSVADPDDATSRCWWIRIAYDDADTMTSGVRRSELVAPANAGGMLVGTTYIIGWKMRIQNFIDLPDNDTISVFQIHGHDNLANGPVLGVQLYVEGDPTRNAVFKIDHRKWSKRNDSPPYISVHADYNFTAWDAWHTWVMEFKEHQTTGVLKIWLDGALIVDVSGEVGYPEVDLGGGVYGGAYWKQGIYRWSGQATWDASGPYDTRNAWYKGAFISTSCTAAQMQAFLDNLDSSGAASNFLNLSGEGDLMFGDALLGWEP